MSDATGQLDTHIEIVTPENITFQYRLAGPFRRLPAFLIDFGVRLVAALAALILVMFVAGPVGLRGLGIGLTLLFWFFLEWFYGGVFEAFWNGQTPGKWLLSIRVISVDGQPISPMQAILRNLLREADAQPICFYQVGLLASLLNDRFQRLGDLASGTMVIVDQRRQVQAVLQPNEPMAAEVVAAIPATFQPTRSLAQALAAYVGRRRMFALGRRLEIARPIAEPLVQRFSLPADTNYDLLLCGLYQRAFIADMPSEASTAAFESLNPFAPPSIEVEPEPNEAVEAVAAATAANAEKSTVEKNTAEGPSP